MATVIPALVVLHSELCLPGTSQGESLIFSFFTSCYLSNGAALFLRDALARHSVENAFVKGARCIEQACVGLLR